MDEAPDPTCEEMAKLITDYVEGALPGPQQSVFEEHIGGCEDCRTYLAQIKQTIGALEKLEPTSVPASVMDRFREALARSRSKS